MTASLAENFTPQESELVASSGRKFKFRELNALEQMNADSLSDKIQSSLYNRMAMSLVSIDGKPVLPGRNDVDIKARLSRIRGSEADELVLAYVKAFQPSGEELKNESAPAA